MGYWQTKVLPQIRKVFDKSGKKAAAAEFVKSFNKEEIDKELEEKKSELEPKVLEVYEAAPAEIKALVKAPKETGVKKNAPAVTKFLEELAKIDFPGSKAVSEVVAKTGPALVAGPIVFLLEKVATFVPSEAPAAEPEAAEASAPAAAEEAASEEKKEKEEEIEKAAAEEAAAPPAAVAEPAPAPAEPAETEPAKA